MSLCKTLYPSLAGRHTALSGPKKISNLAAPHLSLRKSLGAKSGSSLAHAVPSERLIKRFSKLKPKAQAEDSSQGTDIDSIVKDLTEKWDSIENKSTIAIYGVGGIVVLYFTSSIVKAVNSIPLLPKVLELVGFVYTAWFIYRYLLFKSNREELIEDIAQLKNKITGSETEAESDSMGYQVDPPADNDEEDNE